MKRDIDLIRQIMLRVEKAGNLVYVRDLADPEGYDLPVVAQHVEWLEEGGFLKVEYLLEDGPERSADGIIIRQTWKGCEFLDMARDAQTWEKVKELIQERVETTSFALLQSLLTEIVKSSFGKEKK